MQRAARVAATAVVGSMLAGRMAALRREQLTPRCQGQDTSNNAAGLPLADMPMTRFSVANAVEKALPAVVTVRVRASEHIFGPYFGEKLGMGSGFVLRSTERSALIVSNAHVTGADVGGNSNRQELTVVMGDGKELPARLRGVDFKSDLCLLEVETESKLSEVVLGSSEALRAGEWIVVCGSPLTLDKSITVGVMSARRPIREIGIMELDPTLEYIQIDAAVNEGNSGGPILNLNGEVVGIATMKASGAHGISFAIPIDLAKDVLHALETTGEVKRPYLGLQLVSLTPALVRQVEANFHTRLPSNVKGGILVAGVAHNSPAQQAGLRPLDVIMEVDGRPVHDVVHFIKALKKQEEDQGVKLHVGRGGAKPSWHLLTIFPQYTTGSSSGIGFRPKL